MLDCLVTITKQKMKLQELTSPNPLVEQEEVEAAAAPGPSIAAGIAVTDTLLALADRVDGSLAEL